MNIARHQYSQSNDSNSPSNLPFQRKKGRISFTQQTRFLDLQNQSQSQPQHQKILSLQNQKTTGGGVSFGPNKHQQQANTPIHAYGTNQTSSAENSAVKSNKPPHVPSLKEKMHKTALQLSGLATESGGGTTVMNLSHNNTKATAASGGHPMTASSLKKGGRLGREQAMHGGQVTGETRLRHCHRGSLTYLSQLTPSQQPFMSDDRGWPKPEIATS